MTRSERIAAAIAEYERAQEGEMKEYIEREQMNALLKTIVSVMPYGSMFEQSAMKAANDIPAADVEPVVRARWQDGKCTNCGGAHLDCTDPYCPRCGAKMDREKEDV